MNSSIIAQICSSAVTIVGLIIGYLSLRAKNQGLLNKVDDVHTLVNSNLTTAQDRNAQLTATLTAAAIPVPPTPSKDVS
jgi:hypothetical protein